MKFKTNKTISINPDFVALDKRFKTIDMKINSTLVFLIFYFLKIIGQSYYPYQGISFNKVKLQDKFWLPILEVNRASTISWSFTLITYFARSNKGLGEIRLWFPTQTSNIII
jgi:hypothetical protein